MHSATPGREVRLVTFLTWHQPCGWNPYCPPLFRWKPHRSLTVFCGSPPVTVPLQAEPSRHGALALQISSKSSSPTPVSRSGHWAKYLTLLTDLEVASLTTHRSLSQPDIVELSNRGPRIDSPRISKDIAEHLQDFQHSIWSFARLHCLEASAGQ
jgi:hypothetical protein